MNTQPPATAPSPRPLIIVFAITLTLALWFTTRSWHGTILDRHEFRQLQTALSAYWAKEAGFRLDYETPLFGPPWSIPMEFPVYQWIVASASRALGTGLESTARGVSLAFFLATLPAVYCLAGLFKLPPSRRLLVVSAVLASPTYLFYGRSFMIETTALCFSAWFLYTITRAVRDESWRFAAIATACAIFAGLAKVTTFVVFLAPATVMTWTHWRQRWSERIPNSPAFRRATLYAVTPVLVGVATAYWWVGYGDNLKNLNPFSGFLMSSQMTSWNWGTWAQRKSGEVWMENWRNISQFVLGAAPLAVLLFCASLVEPVYRRVAAWCAVFFLCGPLLFINLYYRHDYYYCANAIFLLGGAGFLLAGLWDSARVPPPTKWLALLLVLGGQFTLFYTGYGEYQRREEHTAPAITTVVRDLVPPRDVVIIYGWDWNAMLPYYSERRVIMVPRGREQEFSVLDDILRGLAPLRMSALIIHNDDTLRATPAWLRERLNHLKFFNSPVATSVAGDLYLPEDALPAAAAKLRGRSYAGVALSIVTPVNPNEGKLHENDPRPLALPIFNPAPGRARSMFGFTPGVEAGQPIVLSHPDSELHFQAPPGATGIDAVVGLLAGAYAADNPAITDGVTVEVFEIRADGLRRVLYRRDLDPAREPADRGPQLINLVEVGPFTGPVIFKITPGSKNNLNSDWAYWGRIEIK